jgi:hypothetical protein
MFINLLSQSRGTDPPLPSGCIAIMPVLAEQTIEGASLIKDSQIFIPVLSP